MVSPVRVRVPPLLLYKNLQGKYGNTIEPQLTTRALSVDGGARRRYHLRPCVFTELSAGL
jgi:hypothetical protein